VGPAGATGATGAQGPAGPQGPAGTSSYSAGTGITISTSSISAQNTTAQWNANQLQGQNVSSIAPTSGQTLKWNGTAWTPSNDADGQTLTLSGSTLSISNGNSVTLPSGSGSGTVSGTTNYLSKFTSATAVGNSGMYETSGRIGIGSTTPRAGIHILASDSLGLWAQYTPSAAITAANQAPNGVVRGEYLGNLDGTGVLGWALPSAQNLTVGTGVYGTAGNVGVHGVGQANTGNGYSFGLYGAGFSEDTSIGVYGVSGTYSSTTPIGYKYGVYGIATGGSTNYGVYGGTIGGTGSTNYAGYFEGNVQITGSISKASGTFKIDHPQDPENKYLYHSFVESPDMMNVYNGNITTDANGYAVVTLPNYFESLNKDFRYQLTVMGQTFAQAIVSEKVSSNHFTIRTNQPNTEVSWQVTGVRKDAYANAHRVQAEVEKEAENKGKFLNPVELGKNASLQIGGAIQPKKRRTGLQDAMSTLKR
jgi:hypothetical protein